MSGEFKHLKANDEFAQYWYREAPKSEPVYKKPKRHTYRSIFACDRDRVMYCSAFRRLSSKTQVFNSQTADNLRTRLTHTLEVAQIARTIAVELGLDEALTEAIALGHDVGHTPFGHVGERTLNDFSIGADKKQKQNKIKVDGKNHGFKHNLQSVRVFTDYSDGDNFTNFMLFGVREHSKRYWKKPGDVRFYDMYDTYCSYSDGQHQYPAWSFEAFVVHWADEVAQRHHDIEDAFLQKIMPAEDILEKVKPLSTIINNDSITKHYKNLKDETDKLSRKDFTTEQYSFANTLSSFLVDAYVTILINEFSRVLQKFSEDHNLKSESAFKDAYLTLNVDEIRDMMKLEGTKIYDADRQLGQSLKYSILDSYEVQRMDGKGAYVIRKLVRAYLANPQQLPSEYVNRFIKIELIRLLPADEINGLLENVKTKLGENFPINVTLWKDYECREVLRIIVENPEGIDEMTYAALIRVIFDYIAGMTDSYATAQYKELY